MHRIPRLLALLAVLVFSNLCHAGEDKDNWFIVEALGQRAGWMRSATTTKGDLVTTTSKMHFGFKRGTATIQVSMESSFTETAAGKPISMTAVNGYSAIPITEKYTFKDDGSIDLDSEQNGRHTLKTFPKPDGVWLTPAAADTYFRERFLAGAKEIKVRSMDPLSGPQPVLVTTSDFEKTKLAVDGHDIDAVKMKAVNSMEPFPATQYVDASGEMIRTETNLGLFSILMTASTQQKALANAPAPEIMVNTFIKPDKPIKDPRETKKVVLIASVPSGDFPDLPTTGSQSAKSVTPTSTRLTITAAVPAEAPAQDINNPAYLKATSMANIDDPMVKDLAKKAVESSSKLAIAKAEACRRFVYRFIKKKDLDVGFASASEVARNKEGDCTEHGVLLTALLRANGIPARAVTGLIYADEFEGAQGIFGYHMWAQALLMIDGKWRWVDLDGTLPNDTPFDATHITLSTTDLADGESISGLAAIAPLMGRLQIKVESAE